MKEKWTFYLNGLNFREKILLFIAVALLGGFLGMKTSQALLESFFDYDLSSLHKEKRQAQESKALYVGIEAQKRELQRLDKLISHFKGDEKAYLDELYSLAKQENITFTSIKNATQKDAAANTHSIFIEFKGDFKRTLAFLQAVQHSQLFFEFSELKLARNDDLRTLHATLHLRFVAIK